MPFLELYKYKRNYYEELLVGMHKNLENLVFMNAKKFGTRKVKRLLSDH